jgi:hypothetical protein
MAAPTVAGANASEDAMDIVAVCVIFAVVSVAPPIVHRRDLERLAPSSSWRSERMAAGLDAHLVTLPQKGDRFVVKGDWAAVASVEGAAPLFAPLTQRKASLVVEALAGGVVVDDSAVERVAAAGFVVSAPPPEEPPRYPFSFVRLELRHADSAPALVHVVLDLDEQGHVDRREHVVARVDIDVDASNAALPSTKPPAQDHAAAIARFVSAAQNTRRAP